MYAFAPSPFSFGSSLNATALAASDLYNVCVVDSGTVTVGDCRSTAIAHASGGAPSPMAPASTAVMTERSDEIGGGNEGGNIAVSKCMKCRERTLTKGQRIYLENKFGETGKNAPGSIEVCRPCYNHEKGYGRMREPQRVRYLVDCAARILDTVEREAFTTERKKLSKALGRAVSFTHKALHIEFKSRGNKSKKTLEKERSGKDDAEKFHTKAQKALEDFEETDNQLPPAAFYPPTSYSSDQLPASTFNYTLTAMVEKQGAQEQAVIASQLETHEDLFPNLAAPADGLDSWMDLDATSNNNEQLVPLDEFDLGNLSDFDSRSLLLGVGEHALSDNEFLGLVFSDGENLDFDSDAFSTRSVDVEKGSF